VHRFTDPLTGDADTTLDPSEYSEGANYRVTIPNDTPRGDYSITIQGEGGALTRTITVSLHVQLRDFDFREVLAPFLRVLGYNP
jgi:hypothetical protein